MSIIQSMRHEIGRRRRNNQRAKNLQVVDFVSDINKRLPNFAIEVVFDVGAHIGMTALEFSDAWPNAKVYAFEPSANNLPKMEANLSGKPAVLRIPIGLSDKAGTTKFLYDSDHPSMSRIGEGEGITETINLETVDDFSSDNHVTQIDVMKIDVEGHEMEVLRGAKGMLAHSRIGVLRLECAVDPDHTYHLQFFDLCEFLHPFGYRLFGLYEQSEDALNPGPRLRRFDATFISPNVMADRVDRASRKQA